MEAQIDLQAQQRRRHFGIHTSKPRPAASGWSIALAAFAFATGGGLMMLFIYVAKTIL